MSEPLTKDQVLRIKAGFAGDEATFSVDDQGDLFVEIDTGPSLAGMFFTETDIKRLREFLDEHYR